MEKRVVKSVRIIGVWFSFALVIRIKRQYLGFEEEDYKENISIFAELWDIFIALTWDGYLSWQIKIFCWNKKVFEKFYNKMGV